MGKKVLVVATSRKTRGGITAVIKAHERGEQWNKFHCHWVQTHRDGSTLKKLWYLGIGYMDYIFRIPFYDTVHIHISQPITILRKGLMLKIAKLLGKKIIVHFHAFNVEDTVSGPKSNQYKKFFDNADRIIVLSRWWKDQLRKTLYIPEEKINIIYNPCPPVDNKIIDSIKKEKIILYAGTVTPRKGYADLIKAFSNVVKNHGDWKLHIAGNGEIQRGKDLAKELGISDKVMFHGWISGEVKDSLFSKASIFVLPSYAEGFPMAVLDAWAYGLPVITTPVGGIPDVAVDTENMLIFNPGDVPDLEDCLNKLISSKPLREKLSINSIKFAKGPFSEEQICRQLENIYNNVL